MIVTKVARYVYIYTLDCIIVPLIPESRVSESAKPLSCCSRSTIADRRDREGG